MAWVVEIFARGRKGHLDVVNIMTADDPVVS